MPATIVQDWAATSTGTTLSPTTLAVPLLTGAATAGNLLLLVGNSDATMNLPSGFTLILSSIHNAGCYLWGKVAAGGETSVTISPTSAAGTCGAIAEIGGLTAGAVAAKVDKTASGGSSSTTNTRSTGTTAGTVQADEYAVAIWGYSSGTNSGGNQWSGETNSFVEKVDVGTTKASGTNVGLCIAALDLGSTGTVESTVTVAGAATAAESIVATFLVAAAGPSFIAAPPLVIVQAVNRSYTY